MSIRLSNALFDGAHTVVGAGQIKNVIDIKVHDDGNVSTVNDMPLNLLNLGNRGDNCVTEIRFLLPQNLQSGYSYYFVVDLPTELYIQKCDPQTDHADAWIEKTVTLSSYTNNLNMLFVAIEEDDSSDEGNITNVTEMFVSDEFYGMVEQNFLGQGWCGLITGETVVDEENIVNDLNPNDNPEHYTPMTWVNGETKLNAENMNNIMLGIDSKLDKVGPLPGINFQFNDNVFEKLTEYNIEGKPIHFWYQDSQYIGTFSRHTLALTFHFESISLARPVVYTGTIYDATSTTFTNLFNNDTYKHQVESQDNKVETISQDNTKYPSADAVYRFPNLIEITWYNLKFHRDAGALIPGRFYRITDYQCVTTQPNTSSANHQFDIVVKALSKTELSEEAWVAPHIENNNQIVSFKCIPNPSDSGIFFRYPSGDFTGYYCFRSIDDKYVYTTGYTAAYTLDGEHVYAVPEYTPALDAAELRDITGIEAGAAIWNVKYNDYFTDSNLDAWKIWYCIDNDTGRFAWAAPKGIVVPYGGESDTFYRDKMNDNLGSDHPYAWSSDMWVRVYTTTENPQIGESAYSRWDDSYEIYSLQNELGKGIIYRMIDEFGNECPYDFKNILFTKAATQYDPGQYTNAYTFNYTDNNVNKDASMVALKGCMNNTMKEYREYDTDYESISKIKLNFNVFTSVLNCYNNTFDYDCSRNILSSYCHDNTFGKNCHSNVLDYGCSSNTFAGSNSQNRFGHACYGNYFCLSSGQNTIGTSFEENFIITRLTDSRIGDACRCNILGGGSIILGTNCEYIKCEWAYGIDFGNYAYNISIGNQCRNIKFGTYSTSLSYIQNVQIDNGCSYLYLTTEDQSTPYSNNMLQNIHIHSGIKGTSYNSRKTITLPNRNLSYETNVVATGTTTIEV